MIILESEERKEAITKIVSDCIEFVKDSTKKVPSGKLDGIQYWVDKDALYFSCDEDDSYAAIMFDELRAFKEEDIIDSVLYQLEKTAEDAEELEETY